MHHHFYSEIKEATTQWTEFVMTYGCNESSVFSPDCRILTPLSYLLNISEGLLNSNTIDDEEFLQLILMFKAVMTRVRSSCLNPSCLNLSDMSNSPSTESFYAKANIDFFDFHHLNRHQFFDKVRSNVRQLEAVQQQKLTVTFSASSHSSMMFVAFRTLERLVV
jgi:hypothetical protein